jgi:hypothetical protein
MKSVIYILFVTFLIFGVDSYQAVKSRLFKNKNVFKLSAVPPEIIDRSYNLAAGSAVVGTICGVLENFKGPTAKLFGGGGIICFILCNININMIM